VAVLLGAVLVFAKFPARNAEEQQLAAYHASDITG